MKKYDRHGHHRIEYGIGIAVGVFFVLCAAFVFYDSLMEMLP